MNYRPLGWTGLRVSELGFGCGNVGGLIIRGEPEERVRAVARAMELSINYFDTAPSYGNGQSETNLGRVLKELKAEVYVGTKVRMLGGEGLNITEAIVGSTEESLKRLDREYVDLIQLHNRITPQRESAQEGLSEEEVTGEVVEAFQTLQAQGKARYYGLTGLGKPEAVLDAIDSGRFDSVQVCYNLLNPTAGAEVPAGFPAENFGMLIRHAADVKTGVIVIRVLAAGALSGVEARHPVAAPSVPPIASGRNYGEDVTRAGSFDFLIKEGHVDNLVEASLRFALSTEGISTVLVGYSSIDQLEKAAEYTSRGPLSAGVLGSLPKVWAGFAGD